MLNHVVLMKFKAGISNTDIEELEKMLDDLPNKISDECERSQIMPPKITPVTWIWVVVQNPGGDEQFLGQHDDKKDVAFIPAFYEKGDAQQAIGQLITERGKKYEAQAILFEELAKDAAQHGFLIFMLNSDGEILEEIAP